MVAYEECKFIGSVALHVFAQRTVMLVVFEGWDMKHWFGFEAIKSVGVCVYLAAYEHETCIRILRLH